MPGEVAFAEGIGPWWSALFLAQLAPFVVMAARLFVPGRDGRVGPESMGLNAAVLAAVVAMILSSMAGVVLYLRAGPATGASRWVIGLAIHFAVWAFLGSGMLFAAFQALGTGSSLRARRLAALAATLGAILMIGATQYALWYARTR
jgi:hypothetical protein